VVDGPSTDAAVRVMASVVGEANSDALSTMMRTAPDDTVRKASMKPPGNRTQVGGLARRHSGGRSDLLPGRRNFGGKRGRGVGVRSARLVSASAVGRCNFSQDKARVPGAPQKVWTMYLQVQGSEFSFKGKPISLRGVGLGGWLNLEHFMIGIPGTETEIRSAIEQVYGSAAATQFWDVFFETYTAEADLRFVRELGLNSLRIPINFRRFATASGDFASSIAVRELDRVVAIAERLGLLVIFDLHSAPGGQNPDWHCDNATGKSEFWTNPDHRQKVTECWEQLATRYRDNTTVAGYDLINEPCYFDDALNAVLVDFYATCIVAIRRIDPHHVIFVEGNTYGRDFSMFERNLDDQVAYSFHYYPFLQIPNDLGSSNLPTRLQASLFGDVSLDHLRRTLKRPIWCGETGHPQHLLGSAPALETFLRLLEDLCIGWATWPLKDARAMGLLSPREQSPWMQFVRRTTVNWNFWDSLTEDSVAAANKESRRELFYERLAGATSEANARFKEQLRSIPFDVPCSALRSFAFDECEQQPELTAILRRILSST
jgi:endoglucanase